MKHAPIILPYEEKPYYKRVRKLYFGGVENAMVTTRLANTFGVRRTNQTTPRGEKIYAEFARMTYYFQGHFYTTHGGGSPVNDHGDTAYFVTTYLITDEVIFDVHPATTKRRKDTPENVCVSINKDGNVDKVYSARDNDFVFWDAKNNSIDELENLLNLKPSTRKKPRLKKAPVSQSPIVCEKESSDTLMFHTPFCPENFTGSLDTDIPF